MLSFIAFTITILAALLLLPTRAQGSHRPRESQNSPKFQKSCESQNSHDPQAPQAPQASRGDDFPTQPHPSPRQLRMLNAANGISVMLFSDNFESLEIGSKALGIIGIAGEADFIELWRIQGKEENATCTQICWWEREDHKTHLLDTKTVSYHALLADGIDELEKNACVTMTQANANDILLADLAYHKTSKFLFIPIFFEGALWGFLRLGLNERIIPFIDYELDIFRSIGLFLVASLHRYRTQDALKASEDRFKDVTLATGEIVWELDANGFFSYISSRIREVAGYSHEYLIGKRWEEISTEDYKDVTSQMFDAAITDKIIDNFEHAIVTKDGKTLWFHSAAILLIDSVGVAGLRGTSFNYTKTRETAIKLDDTLQALQRSNLELEQAVQHAYTLAEKAHNANSAKENFLANISHEIRTPLNSISGMLYMLENADPTPLQQTYITQIKEASASLVTIVDNILNFTNIQAGTVESVLSDFNLTDFLQETAGLFSEKLAQKHLLSVFGITSRTPLHLRGDISSLRQIVTNLLDNAIKFTDKGAIGLTCSLVNQRDSSDIVLRLSITDTGIGIPPDQQEEMLQAFTQKDASSTRRFGGTGLGLTIAHQLIHLNGGTFVLESIPDKGTNIHFTFAVQPPVNQQQSYTRTTFYQHLGVLVEDESEDHFFIKHMKNIGFYVDAVSFEELSGLHPKSQTSDSALNTSGSPDIPSTLDTVDNPDISDFTATSHELNSLNNLNALDILAIPAPVLQKHSDELEGFFTTNPSVIPMVLALTTQLQCPTDLPDYITHCSAGPLFTFLPPTPVNTDAPKAVTTPSSEEKLSKAQQRKALEQLEIVIALLEDSDAEGRARFDELEPLLSEIDERSTSEVNQLLVMFQFAEAVPLLKTLKEKITQNGH